MTKSKLRRFSWENEEDRDILCELHLHNIVMDNIDDWEPNTHVEEIQLHEFRSFMRNQLK